MEARVRNTLGEIDNAKSLTELFSATIKNTDRALDELSPPAFVLFAETALQFELDDIAAECLRLFFQKNPPEDQFFCRSLFCRAVLESQARDQRKLKGHEFVAQTVKAVGYILNALDKITASVHVDRSVLPSSPPLFSQSDPLRADMDSSCTTRVCCTRALCAHC